MQNNHLNAINEALRGLEQNRSISSGLLVCNALLAYMGVQTKEAEDIQLSKLKLPNAERYDRWFEAHPNFRGDRACFELNSDDSILEAKFYALQKRSKLFIAGAVNFTQNFEDRDYTRNDPNMRVGVDFFLTPENSSIIVVLSNKGSLRLVELSERLTNTQNEIFTVWENVTKLADKNALHTTIWDSFKLSSLNKKFYEGIANSFTSLTQHLQGVGVEQQLSNQFANRLLGRLLFLWFLRKKNIINPAKDYFTIGGQNDDQYYSNRLAYLFFNVLNTDISEREKVQKAKNTLFGEEKDNPTLFAIDSVTPYLNGGLFDQKSDGEYWVAHKPTFPTGFFKALYDHFDSFNFTTDESTPEYEQIAIDPEMLGRIFESFLATLTTETGAQAKKANGAFYTPREIVSYMSRESLRQYLYTALDANVTLKASIDDLLDRPDNEWALAGTNSKRDAVAKEDRVKILDALQKVKVLDPAVGSGAFPMGVLHKILSIVERLDPNFDAYETKLSILKNNIYGVDIDPTAIEISRLRAWLSIIVDVKDIKKIKPLPNLDFKFVCANSLIGLEKSEASFTSDEKLKPELIRIRDEYYATSSKVKKEKLQKEYTSLTHKNSLFDTSETRQLKSYQPFVNGKSASFYDSELMHGVNGFDLVIGNPPYVQLQKFARTQIQKDLEARKYVSFTKNADLYCLFYERGIQLLKQGGTLIYITSNKWMRAGYGEKLRRYFAEQANPIELLDFGGFKVFDSATVDTNILMVERAPNENSLLAVHFKNDYQKGDDLKNYVAKHFILLSNLKSSAWFIGNIAEQVLKEKIEKVGKPLKDWDISIYRGILTGLNEAFIIDKAKRDELIAEDPKSAEIIKPILRGRDIKRYGYAFAELYIIGTFPALKLDIDNYSAIKSYLLNFGKDQLEQSGKTLSDGRKARKKTGNKWFETQDQINYYREFEKEKVVWPETMRVHRTGTPDFPRFSKLAKSEYCDKTLFFMPVERPNYILGVLNSTLGWFLADKYADKLDVGGYMMQKSFVEKFPIPPITLINKTVTEKIEFLVGKIFTEKISTPKKDTKDIEDQIDILVYELYGLNEKEIAIIEASQDV